MRYEWNKILHLAETNMEGLIFNSELSFTSQVSYVADRIFDNGDCMLVLVVGPSSSGKTTFTKLLGKRLEYLGVKSHTISTDDFFIDRAKVPLLPNGLKDFDSIKAVDVPLLKRTIRSILNGDWCEIPTYDFISGKSVPNAKLIRLHKEDVVILEGIHAFNPILLDSLHDDRILKVSIQPRSDFDFGNDLILYSDELRLLRRTIRDFMSRGHSFESTITQWNEVIAAEKVNIKPYLDGADYRIDSTYAYELFAYRHCIYDALKAANQAGYEKLLSIMEMIPPFPLTAIPRESLLNEFVKYVTR